MPAKKKHTERGTEVKLGLKHSKIRQPRHQASTAVA
jgi:hypothetical protein